MVHFSHTWCRANLRVQVLIEKVHSLRQSFQEDFEESRLKSDEFFGENRAVSGFSFTDVFLWVKVGQERVACRSVTVFSDVYHLLYKAAAVAIGVVDPPK